MAQRIGQSKVLGIAIGEKSLVVAEAVRAGETPRITLAATFSFPQGSSLDNSAALGAALATFLKDKGFTARQAVVGVPARWVLSKAKEVPPADPSVIADALRLQVEGEFSQELRDLSFDYAGDVSADEGMNVLLVALQGKHLTQVKALAEAARLQLTAVTPVGCVLGAATASLAGKPRQAMVVSVGPGGVELAALDGPGTPRVLRHLGASASSPALLAGELRRATFATGGLAQANGNGHSGVNGNGNGHGGPALILWDGSALSDASRRALADAAGARLEQGDLQTLGVPQGLTADVAGAAALAIAALSDEPLPADFLHSKLAEPRRVGLPPKMTMAIAGGVLVLGLLVWAVVDLISLSSRSDTLKAQLQERKAEITENTDFIRRVKFAEQWHTTDPKFLQCLKDLVTRIPDNSRDPLIYMTDVTIHEPAAAATGGMSKVPPGAMAISLLGRAPNFNRYSELIDMLRGNGFTVQAPSFQKAGNSDQVAFRIPLYYMPPQPAKTTAKPATQPSSSRR